MTRKKFLKKLLALFSLPFIYISVKSAEISFGMSKRKDILSLDLISEGTNLFENVIVTKKGEEIKVFSRECSHLGCIVQKGDEMFSCPCHGSQYNLDGSLKRGPATTGLKELDFTVRDGNIII